MSAATMLNQPILASHAIVGGLLHLAMSAAAGIAFAVALAVLIRLGVRVLATPAAYVAAAVAGGALLYVVMMYGFAPLWNREIVDFTPRVPFFVSHLLFGAAVGGWVYWQLGYARAEMRLRVHRPGLGGGSPAPMARAVHPPGQGRDVCGQMRRFCARVMTVVRAHRGRCGYRLRSFRW